MTTDTDAHDNTLAQPVLEEVTTEDLPETLQLFRTGDVAVVRIARPGKRNALNDETVVGIGAFFDAPPSWARAAVLDAEGEHFCAGLDLAELSAQDTLTSLHHSRMWHRAFGAMELGTLPVVAVLKGAVIGGGLELASAAHIRVVEPSAFFALPEGQHGLFVGGGGSVRIPRLVGAHRMADMMLTGRVLHSSEAASLGLAQYEVADGEGLQRAIELATRAARNAPMTNFAVLQALPRIAEANSDHGLLIEALMASAASSSEEAQRRMAEFLAGRGNRVQREQR